MSLGFQWVQESIFIQKPTTELKSCYNVKLYHQFKYLCIFIVCIVKIMIFTFLADKSEDPLFKKMIIDYIL